MNGKNYNTMSAICSTSLTGRGPTKNSGPTKAIRPVGYWSDKSGHAGWDRDRPNEKCFLRACLRWIDRELVKERKVLEMLSDAEFFLQIF